MTLSTKSHFQGSKFMINRRLALGMIAAITTIDASRVAFAKEKHHLNGKDLLGDRIKKNGKHKIHTTGKNVDVFAEVKQSHGRYRRWNAGEESQVSSEAG